MPSLTLHPFEPSPEAYDELASLWTALNPEWPRFGRIWQDIDAGEHKGGAIPRYVARRDGQLVGAGEYSVPVYGDAGTFELTLFSRPEAEGQAALRLLYDAVIERLEPRAPRTLIAYTRGTRPWMVRFYEERGFRNDQQVAASRLNVPAFDGSAFVERALAVARAGYAVLSAAQLAADGDDWQRAYWKLDQALLEDVPILGGFNPVAFEAFAEDLANPDRFQPEAAFIARDADGAYVGVSRLSLVDEVADSAFGNLTGVLPAHRRRGLATALKLATIAHARERGYRWIRTLNEVNNPMLALNHALGFETRYTQFTMQRRLAR